MAWVALSYAFASKLTSTKMTQLFDNFAAMAAKASGAPVLANSYVTTAMLATAAVTEAKLATASVTEAKYGAGSVDQTALKTSAATAAGSLNAGVSVNLSFNPYCFFPMIHTSDAQVHVSGNGGDGGSGNAPRMRLHNTDSFNRDYDVDHRYITV